MKQKIVIKLQMNNEKCRNKALKTAAEVKGVTSVSLEGDDKDIRVSVTGDDVDIIFLANHLKKKFNSVTILSAEEVKKPKTAEEKKKEEEKKNEEEKKKMMETCKAVLQGSCIKCHSLNCHGKCDKCTKCESPKCDGKHCVTICFKCENAKCNGKCNSCSNCHNHKCNGCTPTSSSFLQYHQWWTCPK